MFGIYSDLVWFFRLLKHIFYSVLGVRVFWPSFSKGSLDEKLDIDLD